MSAAEQIPPPDAPSHTVVVAAQPDDIDDLGHVSNLVYVRWVQQVAQAHSTAVGWPHKQYRDAGAVFVVRRHEIDYVAPVFAGDRLELVTWLASWKLASSQRRTAIRRVTDGAVGPPATTLWAFVDYASGRPKKIPDAIRTAFGVAALAVALVAMIGCGAPRDPMTSGSGPGATEPGPRPGPGPDHPNAHGVDGDDATLAGDQGRMAGGGLSADARTMLDEHNRYREAHCAPSLTWSEELAAVAQRWANQLRDAGCAFEHSKVRYGENLAAGTSGHLPAERVVEMWYREVDLYDFKKGGFAMATGHFTQVVWVGTQQLGCARSTCGGLDIWVCNYDPAGNVHGGYQEHVRPSSCRSR